MNLRKCIFTQNACYKAGQYIKPAGIVIHSTGANNPYLRRYVQPDDGLLGANKYNNHWNRDSPDIRVCVHAFIGRVADGSIAAYQTLPWEMRCWGCGSGRNGTYNDSHIQIEICEDGLTDTSYFNAVYKEAVELAVYICMMFDISADSVCDHSEAAGAGYASNHADVSHWFPRHGKNMGTFRADVREELDSMNYEKWKEYHRQYMKELSEKEPDAWSREERELAESIGLIKGDGSGGKQYKAFCSREQMVVFLVRTIKYVLGEVQRIVGK